jgi:hypothetical protein
MEKTEIDEGFRSGDYTRAEIESIVIQKPNDQRILKTDNQAFRYICEQWDLILGSNRNIDIKLELARKLISIELPFLEIVLNHSDAITLGRLKYYISSNSNFRMSFPIFQKISSQ